jgi:hypothetical protein
MSSVLENLADTLDYTGPRKGLLMSLVFQVTSERPGIPKSFQNWRAHGLKKRLFQRQAALFCFGRKCAAAEDEWAFALWPDENSLIDAVFRRCKPSGEKMFEFIQLKEVVPEDINPEHSLQIVLDDLPNKYPETGGITVGIHLHRNITTDLGSLRLPKLNGGSLWLFGLGGKPPQNCILVGDLLNNPACYYFNYPSFFPSESPIQWNNALDEEPRFQSLTSTEKTLLPKPIKQSNQGLK